MLVCCWLITDAQSGWRVSNYSEMAGTPSDISKILQDSHGFIWASTDNGLYRYDGYEWRNFKPHSGDGTRLKLRAG